MGLFGGGNKVVKTFQSNNKLVEIITSYDPDSKGNSLVFPNNPIKSSPNKIFDKKYLNNFS